MVHSQALKRIMVDITNGWLIDTHVTVAFSSSTVRHLPWYFMSRTLTRKWGEVCVSSIHFYTACKWTLLLGVSSFNVSWSSFQIATASAIQQQSVCSLSKTMEISLSVFGISSTFLFSLMLTTLAMIHPSILSYFSSQMGYQNRPVLN